MEWVHGVEIKEWLKGKRLRLDGSYNATYNHSELCSTVKPLKAPFEEGTVY